MTTRRVQASRFHGSLLRTLCAFALVVWAGAACSSTSQTSCTLDADCPGGQLCRGGMCIVGTKYCSATDPCPAGQSCCGGMCAAASCCQADFECPGSYCQAGACQTEPRPSCNVITPCPEGAGRCLLTLGRCVECVYADDCAQAGLVCSPQHECVPAGGCTAASCAEQGLVCAPEQGGCRQCLANAECGRKVCDGGLCVPCTSPSQCGTNRTCVDGECVTAAGTPCTTSANCADGLVCKLVGAQNQCEPCVVWTECAPSGGVECFQGRCVAENAQCSTDANCDPPATICNRGMCEAGCATWGCADMEICNTSTGRCVPFSQGQLPLGYDCGAHSHCLSNVCWPVVVSDTEVRAICSQSCVRHDDCPNDFLCVELGDGNLCTPRSLLGNGLPPHDMAPGGACSGEFVSGTCMTGYCNTTRQQCMQMCGRDADCADVDDSFACIARWPVPVDFDQDGQLEPKELVFTELCHPPLVGGLPNGASCFTGAHDDCASGFCVQTPDYYSLPMCGQPCCTQSDCDPSSPVCKPIDAWDGLRDQASVTGKDPYGFQKVCLWREYQGTKEVGATCASNSECKSEICAQGPSGDRRCTTTCCTSEDCAAFAWADGCRPPFYDSPTLTGDEDIADVNFQQVIEALGRELITTSGRGQAIGISPLCMPR